MPKGQWNSHNVISLVMIILDNIHRETLRRSLQLTLGCIPKQPDSKDTMRDGCQHLRGLKPTIGKASIRRTQMPATIPSAVLNTTAPRYILWGSDIQRRIAT